MDLYHLDAVLPKLVKFIEQLTNWYIKFNRDRLKGIQGEVETRLSLCTVFEVLLVLTKLMAPVTPFITEYFYQKLRVLQPENEREDSVHFLEYPNTVEAALNPRIMEKVANMQSIILLGRTARERRTKPMSLPLTKVTSINSNPQFNQDIEELKGYIIEQLNVKEVVSSVDSAMVLNKALPENKKLGTRLGKSFGKVAAAIKKLSDEQIRQFQKDGKIELEGEVIGSDELVIAKEFKGDSAKEEAAWDSTALIVLDLQEDEKLLQEMVLRRVVNFTQRLRKNVGVQPSDLIEVFWDVPAGKVKDLLHSEGDYVTKRIGVPFSHMSRKNTTAMVIGSEDNEVENITVHLEATVATLNFDNEALKSLGFSEELCEAVKLYYTTRDYARISEELNQNGKLSVRLNGVDVTVEKDKQVFTNGMWSK